MGRNEISFRGKRDIGNIISDAFNFLKQELKPLSQVILVYVVPFILIYAVLQVIILRKIMGPVMAGGPETIYENLWPFYKNFFIVLIFNVFVQSLYISAVYSYLEVYIEKGKGNFTVSDVTQNLFSNSLMVLVANVVLTLIVSIGFILCFIPGIYLANSLSLTIFILLFEKKGLSNALVRSWGLVHSQWWNTFLLNIVAILIIWAAGFVISIPSAIAGFSSTMFSMGQDNAVDFPDWYWIMAGLEAAVSMLLYIIPYTFLAFQYFNIRERLKN